MATTSPANSTVMTDAMTVCSVLATSTVTQPRATSRAATATSHVRSASRRRSSPPEARVRRSPITWWVSVVMARPAKTSVMLNAYAENPPPTPSALKLRCHQCGSLAESMLASDPLTRNKASRFAMATDVTSAETSVSA